VSADILSGAACGAVMGGLGNVNLIRLFDFYLATTFLLSTATRIRQYAAVLGVVRSLPARWPRLMALLKQHRGIFLTWETVAPAALALVLMVAQMLASHLLWPEAGQPPAGLTVGRLFEHPLALPFVGLFGLGMLAVDVYFIVVVSEVDRGEIEKYLDQAEFWLKSWAAPVLKTVTFGYVNPRKLVAAEVQTTLASASKMLQVNLWWVVLQVGLRIGFGASLWVTYALTRPLAA
jgi:hypothetical protein